jgi:hypothetical protein
LLAVVDVAHPIVTSANPQMSPAARNARRCVQNVSIRGQTTLPSIS